MYSVMLLIVSFGGLAGLYVLLDAPFTAVTQIIIYAGAIMVLFLFVVMLLNVPREEPLPRGRGRLAGAGGHAYRRGAFGAAGDRNRLGALARRRRARSPRNQAEIDNVSSVANIGKVLFTQHAFAFEATSILILVAMVGRGRPRPQGALVRWCR